MPQRDVNSNLLMRNETVDFGELHNREPFLLPSHYKIQNGNSNTRSDAQINDSWRSNHFPVTHHNSPRLSTISTPPLSTPFFYGQEPSFKSQHDRHKIQKNSILFGRDMPNEGRNLLYESSNSQQCVTSVAEQKNQSKFLDRRYPRNSEPMMVNNRNEASAFRFQPLDHRGPQEGKSIVMPVMQAQHSKKAEEGVSQGNFKKPKDITTSFAPLQVQSKKNKEYYTPKQAKQFQLNTPTNPKLDDSPQSLAKNILSLNHTFIPHYSPKYEPAITKGLAKTGNELEKLLRLTEYPGTIKQSKNEKHEEKIVTPLFLRPSQGILPSPKSQRSTQGAKNIWVPFLRTNMSKNGSPSSVPNLSQSHDGKISPIHDISIDTIEIAKSAYFSRVPSEEISLGNRHLNFTASNFLTIKKLGEGKYGAVDLAIQKATGFVCALKTISKETIRNDDMVAQFSRELKIHTFLSQHPNIVSMYGFFYDTLNFYIILQLAQDGQLEKMINKGYKVQEIKTANIMKQICSAVYELHSSDIIHRDIKPQNIVVHEGVVKLCDFGWSVHQNNELRRTFCGTPTYLSPQILQGNIYNQKTDIWSLGIMTYKMLIGDSPFLIQRQQEMQKIVTEEVKIPENVQLSQEAKDFIKMCLNKNAFYRVGIKELSRHKFINKNTNGPHV